MRYTYLVGTLEQLDNFEGQEFDSYQEADQYAYNEGLSIMQIAWEFSDSELLR